MSNSNLFQIRMFIADIKFNSIHAFISDKSLYYSGYINYNHNDNDNDNDNEIILLT